MILRRLSSHQIAKWSVVFVAATGLAKAAQFAVFSYLAIVLPISDYGRFGLYYAFLSAMGTFAATGINERTAGQLKDCQTASARAALFRNNTGLFFVVAVSAFLLIAPVAVYATEAHEGDSICALFLALSLGLVLAFATVQGGFLRLDRQLAASLAATVGVLALSIVGMGLAAMASGDLGLLFASGLAGACVGILSLGIKHRLYLGVPNGSQSLGQIKPLLPFVVIGIFGWFSGYGMNTVINETLEIESVAKYTFLFTISSLGHLVASSMNAVWTPQFYDLFNNGQYDELDSKNKTFFAAQAYVLGVTATVTMAAIASMSSYSERLAFYSENGLELGLLFIAYILYVAFYQVVSYYHVTGNGSRLMRVQIVSGSLGFAIWLALIVALGTFGVYLGCAAFALVRSYMLYRDARRDWQISPTWIPILLSVTAVVILATW